MIEAYELDLQNNKQKVLQLEQNLKHTNDLLYEANNQIESEKTELSNLEIVRKDLEAQRSFFTKDLQNSDIKEILDNNSFLLDEKHQLEYKLNKTTEVSQQQIKDLEASVEKFNDEVKSIKGENNHFKNYSQNSK